MGVDLIFQAWNEHDQYLMYILPRKTVCILILLSSAELSVLNIYSPSSIIEYKYLYLLLLGISAPCGILMSLHWNHNASAVFLNGVEGFFFSNYTERRKICEFVRSNLCLCCKTTHMTRLPNWSFARAFGIRSQFLIPDFSLSCKRKGVIAGEIFNLMPHFLITQHKRKTALYKHA